MLFDRIVVPLLWVLVLNTPHLESGFWYPIGQLLFPVPHLSTFVWNTPPIKLRLKYPTCWNSFFIPLCSVFVFHTPILCFRFQYPYLGIWFSEPYVWISFYCFWMLIILYKRLWNFFRKCQFFVRIYGTMCIVIFLGEVLTSMRVCECCSRNVTSSFLIHGNSSSKTYLANRSFLLVPTKGTLLNGTPTKQYVSILCDSLLFFQHK